MAAAFAMGQKLLPKELTDEQKSKLAEKGVWNIFLIILQSFNILSCNICVLEILILIPCVFRVSHKR